MLAAIFNYHKDHDNKENFIYYHHLYHDIYSYRVYRTSPIEIHFYSGHNTSITELVVYFTNSNTTNSGAIGRVGIKSN